jgi:hypothetical protein
MEVFHCAPYVLEIIMYTSSLDECTLAIGDQLIQFRCQTVGKHFGQDFCYAMHYANWPEGRDILRALFFGYEDQISRVQELLTVGPKLEYLPQHCNHIYPYYVPVHFEKTADVAIQAGSFIRRGLHHGSMDFFFRNVSVKITEVIPVGVDGVPIDCVLPWVGEA